MAKEKDSFVIYYEWEEMFNDLSREQRGDVLSALLAYEKRGEKYEGDELSVRLVMKFIYPVLDRNRAKYDKVIAKRADAANKRWNNANAQNAMQNMQMNANAHNAMQNMQTDAKHADSGSGHGSESDSDHDSDSGRGSGREPSGWQTRPTTAEVERYVNQMGYQMDAKRWSDYWDGFVWRSAEEWQRQVDGWARREWPGKQERRQKKTPAQQMAELAGLPDELHGKTPEQVLAELAGWGDE